MEKTLKDNKNNIIYDSMPNMYSKISEVEYNNEIDTFFPGLTEYDKKNNIDESLENHLKDYKPKEKIEVKKGFLGIGSKEIVVSEKDDKWYYDKDFITAVNDIPYGRLINMEKRWRETPYEMNDTAIINEDREVKLKEMKKELKDMTIET